ncbi:MAG: DUF234 domain-containing protein [Lachnospiraceae bacterium]|nr:DUF234 domain-containing protein [Lachnospiraceae bacterium]
MFIGRETELRFLKDKYNEKKGQLIVLYGRNFFRFWYAFGFANLSQLEDVCKEFVRELQKKNALPFRYGSMGRWMGKTTVRDKNAENALKIAETEIDLLGIGRGAKEYMEAWIWVIIQILLYNTITFIPLKCNMFVNIQLDKLTKCISHTIRFFAMRFLYFFWFYFFMRLE